MRFVRLDLECTMTTEGRLAAYKGSMLRGSIGSALRRTCCTTRRQDCTGCLIEGVCPFPKLFVARPFQGSQETLPPPFCVRPPVGKEVDFPAGSRLAYGLSLFAHAVDYAPYFVQAAILAGEGGVGRKLEAGRGTYALDAILCGETSVWDSTACRLLPLPVENLDMPAWTGGDNAEATIEVLFSTPCRFKHANRFSGSLSFLELMLLVLRRMRSLSLLDGVRYSLDGFSSFCDAAARVETVANELRWCDWTRWSNRQGTSMQLGGLVGSVTYRGPMTSFLPFLEYGAKVQVGKQTSFGLGSYSFREVR